MISKNKIREIQQLERRKVREERRLFVGEGPKVVGDLLETFEPVCIVATDDCAAEWERRLTTLTEKNRAGGSGQSEDSGNSGGTGQSEKSGKFENSGKFEDSGKSENTGKSKDTKVRPRSVELIPVSDDELRKVSFLQHPQKVLAVFRMPDEIEISVDEAVDEAVDAENRANTKESKASIAKESLKSASLLEPEALSLALDGVQDPGNLGTIIRIADWFGIRRIYSSLESADHYSPKVVQATMGSLARVSIVRTDLPALLRAARGKDLPVYGTFLGGENLYSAPLSSNGIIVMGNEGRGISDEVSSLVSRRISIPRFEVPSSVVGAEKKCCGAPDSLNVAVATALTVGEFRRQQSLLLDAIKDNGLRL